MPDGLLTEARLRAALGARPFKLYPQAGSTNDLARQWALDGAQAGSVIVAEEQLVGRGRFGRTWSAPARSALLFSVILRPRIAADRVSRLTMVGAVSIAETLIDLAPDRVSLKWPNDVWLAGRKVAGVLPEAIWLGDDLRAVILGIGLNVSVDFTGTLLADRAVSIETITGATVDRAALLDKLLRRIDYWSIRIEGPELLEKWRGWLQTLGQHVMAKASGGEISGQAVGVADDGALLLRSADGTVQRVVAGEVTLSE